MSLVDGVNDVVLFGSLLPSIASLVADWETYQSCKRPFHWWFLVSFASLLVLRVLHVTGTWATRWALRKRQDTAGHGQPDEPDVYLGSFLLNMRHEHLAPRLLASLTHVLGGPLLAFWTCLGTTWLLEGATREDGRTCLPNGADVWFMALWLIVCASCAVVHATIWVRARVFERRWRRAENDFHMVGGDETRARWGGASRAVVYAQVLALGSEEPGLRVAEIQALPCYEEPEPLDGPRACRECAICLHDVEPGNGVRRLPGCGHELHRCCIDLWLLRNACCPLCKGRVGPPAGKSRMFE